MFCKLPINKSARRPKTQLFRFAHLAQRSFRVSVVKKIYTTVPKNSGHLQGVRYVVAAIFCSFLVARPMLVPRYQELISPKKKSRRERLTTPPLRELCLLVGFLPLGSNEFFVMITKANIGNISQIAIHFVLKITTVTANY